MLTAADGLLQMLTLEHDLQVSNADRESLIKDVSNLRHQLTQLEEDRKGLADEYINLKTSYMTLSDNIEQEVSLYVYGRL